MWLFASLLITSYYSQEILAAIAVPVMEEKPKDFFQLSQRIDYKIYHVYVPGFADSVFFEKSINPIIQKINKRRIQIHKRNEVACFKRAALDPNTVCLSWNNAAEDVIAKNLTLVSSSSTSSSSSSKILMESSDAPLTLTFSPVFTKNSKYMENLNEITGWLRDVGVIQKAMKDVTSYNEKIGAGFFKMQRMRLGESKIYRKLKSQQNSIHQNFIGFQMMVAPIGILLIGLLSGLFVFIFMENCIKIWTEKWDFKF